MSINNSTTDQKNDLPVEAESYQSGAGVTNTAGIGGSTTASDTFDRIGSAASEFNDDGAMRLSNSTGNAIDNLSAGTINDDSPLKWIIPLILLFLLVAFGSWFCSKAPATEKTTTNKMISVAAAA